MTDPSNAPASPRPEDRDADVRRRKAAILKIGVAAVILVAMVAAGFAFVPLFGDQERIAALIAETGPWGPLLFIVIQALQVIAAPLPGQITGLASGYLFGAVLGTVYGTIGGTIGCAVVFLLARKLGRPFVETFVSRKALQRFDYIADTSGAIVLFVIFSSQSFPTTSSPTSPVSPASRSTAWSSSPFSAACRATPSTRSPGRERPRRTSP